MCSCKSVFLAIGVLGIVAGNSSLLKGQLPSSNTIERSEGVVNTSTKETSSTSGDICSHEWTKVLDGFIGSDGKLNSVSDSQIKSLETSVENGCDLKVQLITYNGDKGANYVCDDVVLMKNAYGDTNVACKSKTQFSFGENLQNHLYDSVVFSENNGNAFVAIKRDWSSGSSHYTKDNNNDPLVEWTVRAFLRK